MAQTIVEKIAQAHMTDGPDRPLVVGDVVMLRPRHVMTHDNTAAVMKKFAAMGLDRIRDPRQPVFAIDHDVQNRSESNLAKYRSIQEFADRQGVDFYPPGTGIGHQIMVSHGYVVPGSLVVASDSHSNMYGALGALGTPVVRTDAAAIWATGEFWWQIPRTVKVSLEGRLRPGVTGKDVIITLCALYSHGEVLNAVVEFGGPGVGNLDIEARMTISNMTTEWGALAGWFPIDDVTILYLADRRDYLAGQDIERFSVENLASWSTNPPRPDPDAAYAGEIVLDLADVTPHVSGPDSVQVMRSLADIKKDRIAIQKAYLVSCVNSRLGDLESAATIVKGLKIADGVEFYIAAASAEVEEAAKAEGYWQTLLDAGAHPLPPGCGPCIGLGVGLLEPGEVGISATNRNFKGRMGSREAQAYLASPEVVATSAVTGYISGARHFDDTRPQYRFEEFDAPVSDESVEIVAGFPERIRGRLVFIPRDDINTDGIYGKDYTYREDMTPAEMASVVMQNYDPEFAQITQSGDVLVAGRNFGTGSSREQAATSLQHKGIAMVIAASFSQTYLRNAYNNGFICIECRPFVENLMLHFNHQIKSGYLTIISSKKIGIDFGHGVVRFDGREHRFKPLGRVPQSLIAAGGVEPTLTKL